MAKKIIASVIILPILVVLFLLFRLMYCQSWFSSVTLSKELVPLDVVNLFATSIITVFLAWYITKKLSEQRYEKEFVITDLKNIEDQINYIERSTSNTESIELQPLLDLLIKLQLNIDRFNKTVEILRISCKDSKKLDKYYKKLYKKVTDVDGIQLEIDSVKRMEIQNVCTSFIVTTRFIICSINKQ